MSTVRAFKTSDLGTTLLIDISPDDVLPLHFDFTWKQKFKMCWLILCGRQVRVNGPFHFELRTSEKHPPQVI